MQEESDRQTVREYPRPKWRDWGLLAIGLLFVAAGLFILPSDPNVGIVTLAFFGSCTVVFISNIARKLRLRRFRSTRVEVIGGVPIRPSRGRILLFSGWLTGLGLIILIFGAPYPFLIMVLAGSISAVGAIILIGALVGWFPRQFIQFDADAFTIANKGYLARIPWDNIARLEESFWNDNPFLFIWVGDLREVVFEPAGSEARAYKATAGGGRMFGVDFAITLALYDVDLPVLTDAILHYVQDPNARDSLKQSRLGGPAAGE